MQSLVCILNELERPEGSGSIEDRQSLDRNRQSDVNAPEPAQEEPRQPRVPKPALICMVVVVAVLALVSLFANVQRMRRDKIETVTVTLAPSPSPSPSAP